MSCHYCKATLAKGNNTLPASTERWSLVSAAPVFDAQRQVQFAISIFHDVTEQKRREQQLRAQFTGARALAEAHTLETAEHDILRAIGEHLGWSVGVLWLLDREQRMLRFARAWHAHARADSHLEQVSRDCTFSEGVGLPGRVWQSAQAEWLADSEHDDGFPCARFAAHDLLKSGVAVPIRGGNGVVGVLEFFSERVREPEPDTLDVMAAIAQQAGQFIERKRAEESLREAETKYRTLVEQIPAITYVSAFKGENRLLYVSPQASLILGYAHDEWMRSRALRHDAVHPDDRAKLFASYQHSLQMGEPFLCEYRLRTADGRYLTVQDQAIIVRDASGSAQYLQGIVFDVSERKHAEQELRALAEVRDRALAEAQLMNALMSASAGEADLNRILDSTFKQLNQVIAFTGGSIALIEGDDLVVRAAFGTFAAQAMGNRVRRSTARSWRVLETREPLLANDVAASGLRPTTPIRAWLGVPLLWRGEAFGLLEIDSTEVNAFTDADVALMQKVATAVSGSIEIAERYRAERASEERFRSLSVASPVGIFMTDAEGHCTYTNPRCQIICGFSFEQALGTGWTQFVHADDRERVLLAWNETVRNGREFDGQIQFANPTLGTCWTHVRSAPILSDSGDVINHVVTVEDISERKQADEALQRSKEQLEIILQGVADGITAQDASGRLVFANAAAARDAGYESVAEFIGAPLRETLQKFDYFDEFGQPLDLDRLPIQRALAGELSPPELLVRMRFKESNNERWRIIRSRPVLDPFGTSQLAVNIWSDITERRRADEDRARLAAIVESSDDAIMSATFEGVITSWNAGAERMYGHPTHEIVGQHVNVILPAERAHEIVYLANEVRQGKSVRHFETRRLTRDGRQIDVSLTASPLRSAQGDLIGMSAVVRDISERKRAEESQRFLAEAGALLGSSLDYEATLARVADLAIGHIAEWCVVDLMRDGALQQVAIAHSDPAQVQLARDMLARYPHDPKWRLGTHVVVRTQQPILVPQLSDEQLVAGARDEQNLQMLRAIGPTSFMIVPMIANQRTFGTLTFANTDAARPFDEKDLQVAQSLADRAAFAIENARLYRDLQQLNEQLEVRVLERTAELQLVNQSLQAEIGERRHAEEQLRDSNARLRQLSAHVQTAREEERTRVAREIHDELGQVLTAVKMDLTMLGKKLSNEQKPFSRKQVLDDLRSMSKLLDETIRTVREIITELRPEMLEDLGLKAAMEWQAHEYQARTGIECKFTTDVQDINLDIERATAVFRIFQETLTNVARHANATHVHINLHDEPTQFVMTVQDNGRGIAPDEMRKAKSFGILGMRERALLFGGTLDISSTPGQGTMVIVCVPRVMV